MEMVKKVIDFSEKNNLILPNDSILVALSGGADSVTLLHLLSKLRKKFNLSLSAVYVNHQLRKKTAKQEELFCQSLCESLDIELHLASVDITSLAKKNKKGIEETAREYRYELLETLANEYNYTKVALGHHQNDQVETILFRILRGTGKTGLKGIRPIRDIFIRPLLSTTKEEILTYIDSQKLTFCEDSSNKKSVFKRNYIRNKLIPLLKNNLNQNVEKAILNLSDTVSEEEDFLDSIVNKKMKNIVSVSVGNKIIIQKKLYLKCEIWVQRRLLRNCLQKISKIDTYPDKDTIEQLHCAIYSSKKSISISGKTEMALKSNEIILFPRKKITFRQKLVVSTSCHLHNLNYIVKTRLKYKIPKSLISNKNGMIGRFDFDKIEEPLYIRTIIEGDRFCPFGMKGTKKIGNYLTDRKIHRLFRDEVPIVVDKNGIIWVVGHQIDERLKIDNNTKKVLEIDCRKKTI